MSGFEEYLDSKTSVSSGGKSSTADNSNLKPFDIKIDKSKARDFDEAEFQSWYKGKAKQLNIDEDPDNPAHFYDYRAAYVAGAEPDNTGHWPSTFKMSGHPRIVVDGVNTKTGKKVDSSSSSFESFLDTKKPEVIAQPVVAKPEVKEKKGFISRIADTALQGAENISEAEGIAATHGGEALKTLGTGLAAMVPAVGSMVAPSAEGRKYSTGFLPADAVAPVVGRAIDAVTGKGKGKNPFQEAQDRLDRARGIAELFTVQPTTEEAKAAVEIISKPLSIIPELATKSAEYYKKLGDAAEKKGDTKSASAWKALATTTDLGGEVLNFYVLGKVGKAPGKVAKTISDTTWYRKLTIKERALVTELDARISRGMTQDQHRNAVIRDKWKNGTEAEKNAIRNEMVFGIKPEAGERPIFASGAGENLALPEHAYPSQDFVLRGPGSVPRDGLIGRSPGDDFVLRVNEQRPGLPALPPGVGNAAWYTNTERGIVPTDNHPVRQAVREAIAESQAKLPGPPNLGEGFTTKEVPSTAVIKRPSYSVPGPTTGLEVEYKPVVSKSGKPFPTEETAHIIAIDRGYKEGSFEVVPVEDGFGFRRIGTKPKMSNVAERTANTEKPSVQEVSKIDNMTDEVINENGSKYTLDLKGRKKHTQTKRWTNDYGKTWNEGYKVGDEFDLDRGGADVIAVETSVNAKGLSEESTKLIVSALIGEDGVVLEVVPKTNTSSKSSKTQKAADSSMTDEAKALGVEHTGTYEIPGREPVHSYFDPQTKGNFGVGKGETLEQAVKRHRDSFKGSSAFEEFLDAKPKEVETSIPRVDKFIDNLPEGDVVMPENSIVYRGMDKNSKGNWWGDKIDAEAFASLREDGFVEPKNISGKKLADADKFMKDADELGNSEIPTSLTTEGVNKLLDKVIEAGYDGIYSRKTKAILLPTEKQLARTASKKAELGKEAEQRANSAVNTPAAEEAKPVSPVQGAINILKGEGGNIVLADKKPFYSKLESVLNTKMRMSMSVDQLRKTALNNGVTPAEFNDVLGGLKGTVTKQQVMEELAVNGTKFEDVILGEKKSKVNEKTRLHNIYMDWLEEAEANGEAVNINLLSEKPYNELSIRQRGAVDAWNKMKEFPDDTAYDTLVSPTHYEQWTEPGYKSGSYRELFVTAPGKPGRVNYIETEDLKVAAPEAYDILISHKLAPTFDNNTNTITYNDMSVIGHRYSYATLEQAKELFPAQVRASARILERAVQKYTKNSWQDGHEAYSDIQNPIVRIRFNERSISEPLTYNEWLNSTNDFKYVKRSEEVYNRALLNRSSSVYRPNNTKKVLFVEEIQGPSEANQAKMPESLRNRIYDIGVKRVVSYAKENGFDEIAWTNGKMQADRYSLEKHIDEVKWKTDPNNGSKLVEVTGKDGSRSFDMLVDSNGKITDSHDSVLIGKSIAEAIGKAIGTRIISERSNNLSGLDLKVGGEGLKRLYDEMLPALMKKYGNENLTKTSMQYSDSTVPGTLMEDYESLPKEVQQLVDTADDIGIEKFTNKMRSLGYEVDLDMSGDLVGIYKTGSSLSLDIQAVPITSKTPSSFTMYSGLDITKTFETLQGLKENARGAAIHIKPFAEKAFEYSKQVFSNFSTEMGNIFGKMYDKFKSTFDKIFIELLGNKVFSGGAKDWFTWKDGVKEGLGSSYKELRSTVADVWKQTKKMAKSQEGFAEGVGNTTLGEFINQRVIRKSEKSKLEKKASSFKKVQDVVKKEIDDLSSPYGEKKFENLKNKRIADLEKEIKRLEEAKSFTKASTLKRAVTAVKQRNLNTHLAKLKRVDERFNSLIGKLNEKANATFDKEDVKAPQLKTADVEFLKKIPDMKWKPFGGFVENPIYSLEEWGRSVKGGEKKIKEMFVYPIREANKRAAEHFKSIHEKSQELEKSLPKGSSDRIGIYALSKDPEGIKVLEKMKMEVPELTPEELKAYNWMRRGFEVFHEKVNAGRKAAGLEPMGKVDNYFKLAAEISLAERLGFGLNDAYFNKYLHNKGTTFTSALERTGGLKKVRTDAFNIFNEYMQSATRHMYLSPETAKMREYFTKINLGKGKSIDIKDTHPVATKMVTEYLDFVVGQKKNIFPSGVESVIRFINDNNTIATLSASVRTPLVQPTALANTYAEIGPKYLKQGIAGLIDREWYDFAIKESDHLLTREFDVNITPTMSGAVGKVSRFRERFNKSWIGMKPTKFLDHASAVATWIGAYKKAIEVDGLAKGSKEAKQYADDVVIKTQGSAAKEDLAPIQRTNIGKFFTTFQTFVINNWNFLKKEVAGVKNSRISGAEGAHKTARILFAMTVINTLFEDVAGINSPLPSPINAAMENYEETDSELKAATAAVLESLQIMPGVGNLRYGSTILGASPQLFSDLSTKVRAEYTGKGTGREKSWPELGGKVVGVPGTAQATRVAKILERGGSIPQAVIGDYPEDFKQTKKLFRKRFKNAVNAGNSAKANKIQEQANEWNRRVLSEGKPDQVIELE